MGADDDYILGLNTENCPAFAKAINDNYQAFENNAKTTFSKLITNLEKYFDSSKPDIKTVLSYCEYIKWADLHNVPLTFDFTSDDVKDCDDLNTAYVNFYIE